MIVVRWPQFLIHHSLCFLFSLSSIACLLIIDLSEAYITLLIVMTDV